MKKTSDTPMSAARAAMWFAVAAGLIIVVVVVNVIINPLSSFVLGFPAMIAFVLALVAVLYGLKALLQRISAKKAQKNEG